MFFDKEDLYQYIQPKQLEQVLSLNPKAVEMAHKSAVGYLESEIGEIFDLPVMLAKTEDERNDTLLWMMLVLTARFCLGASLNITSVLAQEYESVVLRISTLKSGFAVMPDAEKKEAPNAAGEVVISKDHIG